MWTCHALKESYIYIYKYKSRVVLLSHNIEYYIDDGEIQAAAGDDEDKKKPDKVKSKSKVANKEDHMHKAAKSEPLDNQILRAFGRVSGSHYQVKDGKSAVEQLRESAHIRNVSVYKECKCMMFVKKEGSDT